MCSTKCPHCDENTLKSTLCTIWVYEGDEITETILYPKDHYCKNCGRPLQKVARKDGWVKSSQEEFILNLSFALSRMNRNKS